MSSDMTKVCDEQKSHGSNTPSYIQWTYSFYYSIGFLHVKARKGRRAGLKGLGGHDDGWVS